MLPDGDFMKNPPVAFVRGQSALPLPRPEHGGSILELRRFINCSDEDFVLFVSFLIGAMNPSPPYPLLKISGEQGSGKSTTARIIKMLIDPAKPELRTMPDDAKNVIVAAMNNHLLSYSNLSSIPKWFSDLLCSLSTDGGYSTRTYYVTLGETVFEGRRPVVLNGIGDLIVRSDLLDRAIRILQNPIAENERLEEESFWREFSVARPRIIGALYDAVACALRNRSRVNMVRRPRMLDFARWAVAAEEAFPWPAGSFLSAYMHTRGDANQQALESDKLASLVMTFMDQRPDDWSGTATQLHEALQPPGPSKEWPRWFPRDPTGLGRRSRTTRSESPSCGLRHHQRAYGPTEKDNHYEK